MDSRVHGYTSVGWLTKTNIYADTGWRLENFPNVMADRERERERERVCVCVCVCVSKEFMLSEGREEEF